MPELPWQTKTEFQVSAQIWRPQLNFCDKQRHNYRKAVGNLNVEFMFPKFGDPRSRTFCFGFSEHADKFQFRLALNTTV